MKYLIKAKFLKKCGDKYEIRKELPFYKTSLFAFREENTRRIQVGYGEGIVRMEYTYRAWLDILNYVNAIVVGITFDFKKINAQFLFLDDKSIQSYLQGLVGIGLLKREKDMYTKEVDIKIDNSLSIYGVIIYYSTIKMQRYIKILRLRQKMKGEVYG